MDPSQPLLTGKRILIVDDYLTKPIQIDALQEALERSGLWAKRGTAPLKTTRKLPEVATPTTGDGRQEESIPALDPAVLAELRQFQMEGEPDIVQELAEAFAFETPPLLEALRQAVSEEQLEQLRRAAHNLKGSSSGVDVLKWKRDLSFGRKPSKKEAHDVYQCCPWLRNVPLHVERRGPGVTAQREPSNRPERLL